MERGATISIYALVREAVWVANVNPGRRSSAIRRERASSRKEHAIHRVAHVSIRLPQMARLVTTAGNVWAGSASPSVPPVWEKVALTRRNAARIGG